jgi:hypothetical protein
MKSNIKSKTASIAILLLSLATMPVQAQFVWHMDARSPTGPIAQVALPDSGAKHRTAFLVFEYARNCDPIFSFAEVGGSRLGAAVSQSVLKNSKIGVLLNGKFYSWHAAITNYDNGYEAGFGVTNDLLLQLLVNLDSLVYVTPSGERVPLPLNGFRQSVQSAVDICRKRIN